MLMLLLTLGFNGIVMATQYVHEDNLSGDDFFHKKFNTEIFSAKLRGFQEAPAVLTKGKGFFRATTDGYALKYKLRYKNLSEPVVVRFAHIHFAQPDVNGGILAWLCDNTGGGPAGTPACPASGEKLEGTITADNIQAVQGVEVGNFKALIKIMENGVAYVNVHTDEFPSGEIRGNIKD